MAVGLREHLKNDADHVYTPYHVYNQSINQKRIRVTRVGDGSVGHGSVGHMGRHYSMGHMGHGSVGADP